MRDFVIRSLVLLAATAMIAPHPNSAMITETTTNPLIAKWEGPYGGVPPFDKVQVALFKPALEAAMTEQLAEIDKIANNTAPPDFENTIAAMERAGNAYDRAS